MFISFLLYEETDVSSIFDSHWQNGASTLRQIRHYSRCPFHLQIEQDCSQLAKIITAWIFYSFEVISAEWWFYFWSYDTFLTN